MPGLLATAALTAVVVREEIPGFSSASRPKSYSPSSEAAPANAQEASGVAPETTPSSGTTAATKVADRDASAEIAKKEHQADAIPGGVAALFDRSFRINHGGDVQNWKLSLKEVSVLDADGQEHVHRLEPAATPDTYESRIAEFEDEGRVLPVVYPEGEEGNAAYRRLVSKNVMVQVPEGTDRESLVGSLGLSLKTLPAWTKKFVVMSAKSPLAALAQIDTIRENKELVSAEVQLAMQMGKRAMPNDPLISQQWHLKYNNNGNVVQGTDINVESVWNYPNAGTRGAGVVVGIVDDGLQTNHPDFAGNINTAIDYDFNGNDADPSPGNNDDHGTACAGDVGARGNNGIGVSGSAPEATLVGYRLISGPIEDADIGDAIAYEMGNVHIKSNSWGPTDWMLLKMGPTAYEQEALEASVTTGRDGKGTVFLWAGGNGNDYGDNSNYDGFANSIYSIGVGAMDSMMRRSYYSEFGANLLVTAPSNGATPALGKTTTDRTGAVGYSTGDYTDSFGGTSSATPTTSGIVALMLSKNPNLGYRDVQEILATTAKKINPNDAGWSTNSAGFHFHHAYGAGLVDAAAAVALAENWENLGALVHESRSTGSGQIPENTPNGLVKTFDFSSSNVRVEHVTLSVGINHSARGNLEINLTSPSGVTSRLATVHGDSADNYSWTFMTTHNWGESAKGIWTVTVSDRSGANNTSGGNLIEATLSVHGTNPPPKNPGPLVKITSPANGTVFTPGSTVTVEATATDLDADGNPGAVAKVELFDNGTLIGTDTEAPYSFEITPADGPHALVAVGTDTAEPEAAVSESAAVAILMKNSPPVITAASIGGTPAYADTALNVSGIVASDQDGDTPIFTYQWQKSSDGRNFSDAAGLTEASLAPAPTNAGYLWRCQVTPGDGEDTGAPFATNIVNLVARPGTLVAPGAAYSYQSGLVLKSNGSEITRDAIINEFSQGPMANGVSGFSEWVEILTLRQCSLRNWSLRESSGIALNFQNAAVWDNIPAGTRIVIYVGGLTKDSLLPGDDTNFADLQVVIPSTNATYFVQGSGSAWPPLANTGDVISLRNASNEIVSEVGYGLSSQGQVNIGDVDDGQSAYFTGNSDLGSKVAEEWLTTSSMIARSDISPMAPGDLIISEYILGNVANDRGIELFNPSSVPVDLAAQGYRLQIHANSLAAPNQIFTLPLTGTVAPGGTFLVRKNTAAFSKPGAEQTTKDALFTWNGDDTIILRKNNTAIDSIGQIGADVARWGDDTNNTSNKIMRRNPEVLLGDTNPENPYTLTGWNFVARTNYTDVGKHTSNPKFMGLSATPTTFLETAGATASLGTIALATAPTADVVFTLVSSETDTVTVPATVTIPAGQTSVNFPIAAIDDAVSDGTQVITIEASAPEFQSANLTLTINDDEVSIVGVTPGKGNNAANTNWIANIVAGIEDAPSVFRLGTGITLPTGLTLNTSTGLISGTVDAAVTGSFNVVIERYNVDGDVTSQSYVLTVGTEVGYDSWIAGFPGLSATGGEDDPESDGLKNLIEFYLGLDPSVMNSGAISSERTATTLSITFRREKGIGGVTGVAQWSDDLGTTWSSVGVTEQIVEDNPGDQLIKASVAITGADTKKFMRLNVTQP
ncbi:S8 family serine peptidase [Luteolibacter luteus]|uniref:S8 family serine peptidase n=1 Tax=Luteolibacter luteus TaxID=2728835 RepID=A0A858RMJ3_9BACT|nr:S8 family serine peptidase [Luteolibacter luteus]QJE97678.1 S8 family serine peptidase [Luteolibacter luteus]